MRCPDCGRSLPEGAAFCPSCNRRIPGAAEHDEYAYEAFISYRHTPGDRAAALFVQRTIEGFRLPPEVAERLGRSRLGRCFRDEDELPASDSLPALVEDALVRSRHLIVVCSPQMRESRWVEREVELFSAYHGRGRVLLALSAGEPEESFPPLLTAPDADGRAGEPLAADLRGTSRRRRRDEALRLVAAIAGCGYDDLRQRERARRRGRLAAAASVVAAVSIGFAAFALVQQARVQENYEMALVRQSEYLADEADTLRARGDRLQAVQVALEALGDGERPYVPEARLALERALQVYPSTYWTPVYANRELSSISEVVLSADKNLYATRCGDDAIRVYDVQSGLAVCEIPPATMPDELTGAEGRVSRDRCLFAGEKIVCVEGYRWVVGYDARTGEELYRVNPDLGSGDEIACSEDGRVVAFAATSYSDDVTRVAFLDSSTGETLSTCEVPKTVEPESEWDFSSSPFALSADGGAFYQPTPDALCALDRRTGTWNVAETGLGVAVDVLVEGDALYVTWFDEREDGSQFVISSFDARTLERRWAQRFAATARTPATIETPTLVEVAESELGRHLLVTMDTHVLLLDVGDGSVDLDKESEGVVSAASVVSDTFIAYVGGGRLSTTSVSGSSYRGVAYQGDLNSSPYTIGGGLETGSEGVSIFTRDGRGYCLLEDAGEGRVLLCQLDNQLDLPAREDVGSDLGGNFSRTANGEYLLALNYEDGLIRVLDGSTFEVLQTFDLASLLSPDEEDPSYSRAALSSELDEVLYAAADDAIYAVDVTTGEVLGTSDGLDSTFGGMSVGVETFDGRLALVVGEFGTGAQEEYALVVADARTLEVSARVSLETEGTDDISDLAEWCLFGDYLVVVDRGDDLEGTVHVFDATTGKRVESAFDGTTVARTSGELAGHFVESGISSPSNDATHYLTFDQGRSLLAVNDVESGTIKVFDQHLDLAWEALGSGTMLDEVTFLMFLPSGDLLVQGRTSFNGMGQHLLVDGETGDIVATSNEASLIERGWVSRDGTTLFAQTQGYAIAQLDGDFVTGIVAVSLDPDAFGEQSQMGCAVAVSLDERRALFFEQVWGSTFTLPLYTTEELVSRATELVDGHELTDVERLLYHLE